MIKIIIFLFILFIPLMYIIIRNINCVTVSHYVFEGGIETEKKIIIEILHRAIEGEYFYIKEVGNIRPLKIKKINEVNYFILEERKSFFSSNKIPVGDFLIQMDKKKRDEIAKKILNKN